MQEELNSFTKELQEYEGILRNATIEELKIMTGTLKFEIRQKKYAIDRINLCIKDKEKEENE